MQKLIFMENQNKHYTWDPSVEIKFTGQEFGAAFNGLKFFMDNPLAPASCVVINEVLSLFNKKFQSMIETGVAKVENAEEPAEEVEAIPE